MSMIIQPARFGAAIDPSLFNRLDADDIAPGVTLSNSNLTATKNATTGASHMTGKYGKASGKWRFQATIQVLPGAELSVGICGPLFNRGSYLGSDPHGVGAVSDGRAGTNGSFGGMLSAWAVGDVIDVYVDCDAKRVWFGKNGTISGNPTAGTGGIAMHSAFTKAMYPDLYMYIANGKTTANFSGPFTHNLHPTFLPWTATQPADRYNFRAATFYMDDVGWYAHAAAEFMLRPTSGGANLLLGGTASALVANDGTTAAMGLDDNPATSWIHSNGSMNQRPSFFAVDMGSNAARLANYIAIQARAGTSGEARQAPRNVRLFVSPDNVAWYKTGGDIVFGVGLDSWTGQTPGQIKEFALGDTHLMLA